MSQDDKSISLAAELRETQRLIKHLRMRVDELAASRHRNAELAWKAERQLSDTADFLVAAMGYKGGARGR